MRQLAVYPGSFMYEVGRNSVIHSVTWTRTFALLLAAHRVDRRPLVAEVEMPDGSGGVVMRVPRRTETSVASIPRPGEACEIRPLPRGHIQVGSRRSGASTPCPRPAARSKRRSKKFGPPMWSTAAETFCFSRRTIAAFGLIGDSPPDPDVWTDSFSSQLLALVAVAS